MIIEDHASPNAYLAAWNLDNHGRIPKFQTTHEVWEMNETRMNPPQN